MMPCITDDYPPSREEVLARKMPAVLCAIIRSHSAAELRAIFGRINWTNVGVTAAEVDEWWRLHNERDADRIAQEKAEFERAKVRAKAMAKLTPAERRELGL